MRPYRFDYHGVVNVPRTVIGQLSGVVVSEFILGKEKTVLVEITDMFKSMKRKDANKVREVLGFQRKRLKLPITVIVSNSRIWYKLMVDKDIYSMRVDHSVMGQMKLLGTYFDMRERGLQK